MVRRRQLRCSFCWRKEAEVSKLVAGPRVYICDECVALASRIMSGDTDDQSQPPQAESSLWRRLLTRVRSFVRGGDAQRVGSVSFSSQ
jgi:ATP-dependent Clp protease ATP-binding subunit ClpX